MKWSTKPTAEQERARIVAHIREKAQILARQGARQREGEYRFAVSVAALLADKIEAGAHWPREPEEPGPGAAS